VVAIVLGLVALLA